MAERSLKKMMPATDRSYLSDDIIFSILSRLPVKSLLRFTSVSKSWNAMIKSSNFIAAHHIHHHQIPNNNSNSHLVYMPDDGRRTGQVCTVLRKTDGPPQKYIQQSNVHLPLRGYKFVGVCEGLICLTKDSDIYIWNPCVGILKIVPSSEPRRSDFSWRPVVLGFGFARRSRDFRVVKLTFSQRTITGVEIYSLAADSWRRIERKPARSMIFSGPPVFFEGSIYWLAFSDARTSIFRFDLEEEIFEEMAAPPFPTSSKWELAVVNGSLILLEVRRHFYNKLLNVWVWIKESESSWIAENFIIRKYRDEHCSMVSMTKNGHLIFERSRDRKLFAYEYDSDVHVFKLIGIELSNVSGKYHLIPMRETLFLTDELHQRRDFSWQMNCIGGAR